MSAPLVVCDRWSVPHPLSPIDYRCVNPRPAPKQCQCGDSATLKASKIRQPGNETCEFCWRHEWAEQPSMEYPEIEC